VVGNVKFDLKLGADIREQGRELRTRHWGARPVWIAGSTHAGEEELVLAAHTELASGGKNPLLLLVPRHPDRFDEVAGLLARRGFRFERRSGRSAIRADTQVVLVDTVGELVPLYASVDVAFVGGSLLPIGGHNLLEPAALGVPVVTGPYNTNSKNIAELLLQHGAALQVHDSSELGRALRKLLADPAERQRMGAAALRVVESNRGSVERVLELIEPLMRSFSTGESAGPSRGTRPGSRPPD
jgi:3-deoxy-D-manno-octulosonic-acid transferase